MIQISDAEGKDITEKNTSKDDNMPEINIANNSLKDIVSDNSKATIKIENSHMGDAIQIPTNAFHNAGIADLIKSMGANKPLIDSIRAVNNLSTHTDILIGIKDIVKLNANFEALKRTSIADDNSLFATMANLKQVQNIFSKQLANIQSINKNFTFPLSSDISAFSQSIQGVLGKSASILNGFQVAMAGMRHPWMDIEHKQNSLDAFTKLYTIGSKLRQLNTYGESLSKYLRNDLGDWRDKITLTDKIIETPSVRNDFYRERGFNHNLVEFPEDALDEMLNKGNIIPPAPDLEKILGTPFNIEKDTITENEFQFNNKAYSYLLYFEISFRKFINEKMSAEFGTNWPNGQLPSNMLDNWQNKKESYIKNRQTAYTGHIIEFADFTEYELIINRKDNWNRVFRKYFQRPENVRETFQRLYPLRIDTMHGRLISKTDYLLLFVELNRLHKACNIQF